MAHPELALADAQQQVGVLPVVAQPDVGRHRARLPVYPGLQRLAAERQPLARGVRAQGVAAGGMADDLRTGLA